MTGFLNRAYQYNQVNASTLRCGAQRCPLLHQVSPLPRGRGWSIIANKTMISIIIRPLALAILVITLFMASYDAMAASGDFSIRLVINGDDLTEMETIVIDPERDITVDIRIFDVARDLNLEKKTYPEKAREVAPSFRRVNRSSGSYRSSSLLAPLMKSSETDRAKDFSHYLLIPVITVRQKGEEYVILSGGITSRRSGEMADALRSGRSVRMDVGVQISPSAPPSP